MRKKGRLSTTDEHRDDGTMFFLSVLFQIATDWCREIVLDVLGRRAEDYLGRLFNRGRRGRKTKRRRSHRFEQTDAG